MNGRYRTTLTGAFPRTEELVQATRDLDRGRITQEAAEATFARAQGAVDAVETRLDLDCRTGGYLRWADLFRPFSATWSHVRTGPLTRFFETNTFFRQPILEAPPTPAPGRLASWLPKGPRARAVLPGPYTFARLADAPYAAGEFARVVHDVAGALAEELRGLGADRPPFVQFQEPLLAYEPYVGDPGPLLEAYRLLSEASAGASTSVWTFFGDATPSMKTLVRLPVDAIGVDLFELSRPVPADLHGKALGVGVVESRTTIPEDLGGVVDLVRAVEQAWRPTAVWLGPSPPLDLLPFTAAESKLALLPKLKEALSA